MGVPPGPVAVPLVVSVAAPGATASNRIAASKPVPEAPVASAARASVISTRLPLTCWLNATFTPPARMKLPSCTVRTRSFVASNVMVSVIVETRDAPEIEIGTTYGPPPMRNVVPLGDTMICAWPMPGDVAAGSVAGGAAVCPGVAGGVAAGCAGVGCAGVAGGVVGSVGVAGVGGAAAGGGVAAGGGASTVPGTGVLPGGAVTNVPSGARMTGGAGAPGAAGSATPGCGAAAGGGGGGSTGGAAMSGGGPPTPRFCCDPM